jgi:hypothetical protein
MTVKQWTKADVFIAPTHMNCDEILDGKVIVTVGGMSVPIGHVKDRRALTRPVLANAAPSHPF